MGIQVLGLSVCHRLLVHSCWVENLGHYMKPSDPPSPPARNNLSINLISQLQRLQVRKVRLLKVSDDLLDAAQLVFLLEIVLKISFRV